jgi:hypothetical protein
MAVLRPDGDTGAALIANKPNRYVRLADPGAAYGVPPPRPQQYGRAAGGTDWCSLWWVAPPQYGSTCGTLLADRGHWCGLWLVPTNPSSAGGVGGQVLVRFMVFTKAPALMAVLLAGQGW